MDIQKPAEPFNIEVADNPNEITMDIPPLPGDATDENTFDFGEKEPAEQEFYANLADSMDEGKLDEIVSDLLEDYDNDLQSRKDWEDAYRNGLDLLGLKIEERTEPWDGACGAFHPIISEATVRFQAEAITETFPAGGPVKTQIVGQLTPQKEEQAARVREDMNYWTTSKMKDYRSEHERLLWSLSLCGSAFKKIYADPVTKMPRAMFVPAEDFVVSFGASDLWSAHRYTHLMRKTKNEVKKLQASGFYRDIDIGDPEKTQTALEKKKNKIQQQTPVNDERYQILEMHVELDLDSEDGDGIADPYVVTINKATKKVLSIYRNWLQDDTTKQKRIHFIHYPFVPGFGFYCYGWLHLIGGSAKAATSLLRQLVDAGTLSNLPGGLKARGLRIKSDDTPISPGEWRDVDIPGGKIQDNIMPLPYKEPSATLYQLLTFIVDAARQFANVAEMKIGDANQETPVGTTLAVLERSLKIITAIQARIHAAMREEFVLLRVIIRDNTPEEYDYDVDGGGREIKKADYSDVVDILPVSDPNSTTLAQRIIQYQAALQLAQTNPSIYNMPQLHRDMLGVLGFKSVNKIIPSSDDMLPVDPITENMSMLSGKPVKTFLTQDHEAHIQAHMSFAQDPKIQAFIGQSPTANQVKGAFMAHIAEHVGYAYRGKIEKEMGIPMPPPDQPMTPEIEAQLAPALAAAASKLLGKDVAEAKAQQIAQQQQDPVLQMQKEDLRIKAEDVERKKVADQLNFVVKQLDVLLSHVKDMEQFKQQKRMDAAGVILDVANTAADIDRMNDEAEQAEKEPS